MHAGVARSSDAQGGGAEPRPPGSLLEPVAGRLRGWRWRGRTWLAVLLCGGLVSWGGGLQQPAFGEEGDAPAVEDAAPAQPAEGWAASTSGLMVSGVSGLVAHPKDQDVLYAHVLGLGPAVSRDRGANWTRLENGIKTPAGPRSQVRISLDERQPETLYVVVDGHIYRSEDSGQSFTEITSGALATNTWDRTASAHLAYEVLVDPKKSVQLLVGTYSDGRHHGGLFESADGGRSWEQIAGSNLEGTGLGSDTFWIRRDPKTEKNLYVAGRMGGWFSDDRGRSFERNEPGDGSVHDIRHVSVYQQSGRDLYLADAAGLWRSKDAGKKWSKEPILVADVIYVEQDPHDKKRLRVITRDRGVLEGDEAGRDWRPLGGTWRATAAAPGDPALGYRNAAPREVLAHPRDRKLIYLGSPETGLHLSNDDGATFQSVEITNAPEIAAPIAQMVVGAGGAHLCITQAGRVLRSMDEGATWAQVGVLDTAPGVLVAGAEPGEWFAAGGRLLKSVDGGATWSQLYAPAQIDEHIAACNVSRDGSIRLLLSRSGVVAVSKDRGATWTSSPEPRLAAGTWAVALGVDAAQPDHWLVALRSLTVPWTPSDTNGGILETWDGGKVWKRVDEGLRPAKGEKPEALLARRGWNHARLAVVDPASGLLLYGCDSLGLFGRLPVRPDAPKPEQPPRWVRLGEAGDAGDLSGFSLSAWSYELSPDGSSSRLALQLHNAADGRRRIIVTSGAALRSSFDARLAPAKDDAPEPTAWTVLPAAPAQLASLAFDPGISGRLVGGDVVGVAGCVRYTPPGSAARGAAADAPSPPDEAGPGEPASSEPKEPLPATLRLLTTSADGTARMWNPATRSEVQALSGHQGSVQGLAALPDGGVATAGADRTVRHWRGEPLVSSEPLDTGSSVNTLLLGRALQGQHWLYAAQEDGKAIVALPLAGPEAAAGEPRVFRGHGAGVRALAQGLDAQRLYSGSADQTVKVWDTAAGMEVLSIAAGGPVSALAVSADGSRIYAGVEGFGIKCFDASGATAGVLEMGTGSVNALLLSHDGATLYAASTAVVGVIDSATLAPRGLHTGPKGAVLCLHQSADARWLAAGDDQGEIWLFAGGEDAARWHHAGGHQGAVRSILLTEPGAAAASAEGPASPPKDTAPEEGTPKEGEPGVPPPPTEQGGGG